MKFEGPAPETETRQVSMSFAAFIVAAAVVLFGMAMVMGTMASRHPEGASQAGATGAQAASGFTPLPPAEATGAPPAQDPDLTSADNAATASGNSTDTPDMGSKPTPTPAPAPVATAQDDSATSAAVATSPEPAETHDASFPTHRSAAPAPAPAAASPVSAAPPRQK